jgi:hypothetical protein
VGWLVPLVVLRLSALRWLRRCLPYPFGRNIGGCMSLGVLMRLSTATCVIARSAPLSRMLASYPVVMLKRRLIAGSYKSSFRTIHLSLQSHDPSSASHHNKRRA